MKKYVIIILAFLSLTTSCTKDYLDKRNDQSLLVPTSPEDFQRLLDASFNANLNTVAGLNEIASDNFSADDATLLSLDATERNAFLWEKDIYQGATVNDWNYLYNAVFVCNVVLEGLDKLSGDANPQIDQLKGTALYYRANAYLSLAQQFAEPYVAATAIRLKGIPIRSTANVNEISGRGTLQATYEQVVRDFQAAASLLGETTIVKTRPTKAAAFAMLGRTFLIMGDYAQALMSATAALNRSDELINYNDLAPSGFDSPFPFILPNGNVEALCFENLVGYSFFVEPGILVDEELFKSYADHDLRKTCFFADQGNGGYNYVGSYTGDFSTLFGGPATDELFLIRAECYARQGNAADALKDLNSLLETRWLTGTYQPYTASDAEAALRIVLQERRKELIGRGLRWSDLRRLNQEDRFKKTLTRQYNGSPVTLPPGDRRYTFPIPDEEIRRSGIEQNER